jgi:hypothetical protein
MPKPSWYKKRIISPTTDFEREAVAYVQRVLSLEETGELDDLTKSKLRGVQFIFGLPTTGVLDDATAEEIERIYPYGA